MKANSRLLFFWCMLWLIFCGFFTHLVTIVDRGINTRCTFFDKNWMPQDVCITYDFAEREIDKPLCFAAMKQICKMFYKDIGYLRLDFYLQENKILHIGELTLTPGGGDFQSALLIGIES